MVENCVSYKFVVTDVLDHLPWPAAMRLEDGSFFAEFIIDALAVDR